MSECPNQTCFVPDTGCALGHMDRSKCPVWTTRASTTADAATPGDEVLLPWPGTALGLADVGFVVGRAKPLVVGIFGAENAGKTTLLAAWYLLLGRGLISNEGRKFAGSYSLAGWEAVANALRWGPGHAPTFPPHTTSRGGRAPGLLHLAFRHGERLKEYLFADAPGEWFGKWAVNRDAKEAVGAAWLAEHADVFLLMADREALAGSHMGSARSGLQLLATRVAAELKGRPVALVWSKSDVPISSEIEDGIRVVAKNQLAGLTEFSVSVIAAEEQADTGSGLIETLNWVLSARRPTILLPEPASNNTDPLFLFGSTRS